jgi:hypothetical protein
VFVDATDPRDRIYGLYGIAADSMDEELTPDYNKTVEEVYIPTARTFDYQEQLPSAPC